MKMQICARCKKRPAMVFITRIENDKTIIIKGINGNNKTRVIIEDNGSGIDEETIKHIFEKYSSSNKSRKKLVSGLGLYIVKDLVTQNDGTIYKRNRVKFDDCCLDQITEKDKIRLNKIIEQNQSEYQKFMSIEKEVYSMKEYTYHLPEGYTIDDMTKLFDSYRKELPERFTFSDLRELCKKKESPIIY